MDMRRRDADSHDLFMGISGRLWTGRACGTTGFGDTQEGMK